MTFNNISTDPRPPYMNTTQNRILVIDDDPDIGTMIKTMLEFHGYSVAVSDQAEQIDQFLARETFNLLIMDMLLSGMNGTEVCAGVKSAYPLPVVMISAHPHARELCLAAGADDFISKPFDMQELIGKIRQFVSPVAPQH